MHCKTKSCDIDVGLHWVFNVRYNEVLFGQVSEHLIQVGPWAGRTKIAGASGQVGMKTGKPLTSLYHGNC